MGKASTPIIVNGNWRGYVAFFATVFIKNQPLIVRILLGHFADNHINLNSL